ncbi:VPA1267 family protein, partial [Aeromonas veronii]
SARIREILISEPAWEEMTCLFALSLEDGLRTQGVLPPLTAQAKASSDNPKTYDPTAHRRQLDAKRVSTLEQENIELKAQLKELKTKLERFGELSETLAEMGILPR